MRAKRRSRSLERVGSGGDRCSTSDRYASMRSRSSTCSSRPTARSSGLLVRARVAGRQPDCSPQLAPTSVAGVHVLEIEPSLVEIGRQVTSPSERSSSHLRSPLRRDRLADAAQHDLARHGIELHVAPGGQERKVALDLALDVAPEPPSSARNRRSKRNSRRWLPTKSSTVHSALPRARRSPRPSCWRNSVGLSVGRSSSSVSTFGTSTPSLKRSTVNTTLTRPARDRAAPRSRSSVGAVAPDRHCRDAAARNCSAMKRACATVTQNPSASHRVRVADLEADLLDDPPGPGVVGGEDVGEGGRVVAGAALPRHLAEVGAVVHAEVRERHEILLVDRVPDPQLGGDPTVEVPQDVEAVGSLGRRGHAEQLPRLQAARAALGTTARPRGGTRRR